jgi:hypothetical protein
MSAGGLYGDAGVFALLKINFSADSLVPALHTSSDFGCFAV